MIRNILNLLTAKGRAKRRRALAMQKYGYYAEFRIGNRIFNPRSTEQ
jgi:hypothetical protein